MLPLRPDDWNTSGSAAFT